MDRLSNDITALCIIGLTVGLYAFVIWYLNRRRDDFYAYLATKFNLQFYKAAYPIETKAENERLMRRLKGQVNGKEVLIEETFFSPISPLYGRYWPRPLFGNNLGSLARTYFFVNNQAYKDVYVKESVIAPTNYVAPKRYIEEFLSKL